MYVYARRLYRLETIRAATVRGGGEERRLSRTVSNAAASARRSKLEQSWRDANAAPLLSERRSRCLIAASSASWIRYREGCRHFVQVHRSLSFPRKEGDNALATVRGRQTDSQPRSMRSRIADWRCARWPKLEGNKELKAATLRRPQSDPNPPNPRGQSRTRFRKLRTLQCGDC
jgi:hypothetical protein